MNMKMTAALGVAIILQFFVLIGIYLNAALPLWTGTEVRIKTIPVDPRSLFRGNYARLEYEFSRLESGLLPESGDLRNGEPVYVVLQAGADGLYSFARATLEKPAEGVYLRGRIENRRYEERVSYFRINYGIEAFFAPKDKALQLESALRDGGVAVLMVSPAGKARLKDVAAK